MQTDQQIPKRGQSGFTLMEVALAIGLVAFGLVAVLGVLPAGLNVQKDNREKTIINLDAEYWMSALLGSVLGSPLPLDAFNQIEWIELESGGKVYRADFVKLSKDPHLPMAALMPDDFNGALKQATWREVVTQWMLNPSPGVKTSIKVSPLNGPLFDRIIGRAYLNDKLEKTYLPGGDFAFKYLLESTVTKLLGTEAEVKLTFKWPVLDDPTVLDPSKTAADLKTASSKTYSIIVPLTPVGLPVQPPGVIGQFILRHPRDYIPDPALGSLRYMLPADGYWDGLFGFEPE